MKLTVSGKRKSSVEVSEGTFGQAFNPALVHQVVTAFLAGGRQGSKAQKTRSQVRGGGRKPFRQKGMGRARAGTIRSPLWRGGGKVFAATPRSFSQKVNRKMYRGAMRCILSELVRQDRLVIVTDIEVAEPKTKHLAAQLKSLDLSSCLIVTHALEQNLYFAARNLPEVDVSDVDAVTPAGLIGHEKVLITVDALKGLEEALQ
jgi:large subunit ribosomal protein L4